MAEMNNKVSDQTTRTIEFFFDLGSPWSYIASTQLKRIEERHNIDFQWRPILLGGLFKTVDNSSPFFETSTNKRNYLLKDMQTWIKHYDIDFSWPTHFPPNTLQAMRAAIVAESEGLLKPFARAMFTAFFVNNRDISDSEVIFEIAEASGMDRTSLAERISRTDTKKALINSTEEAAGRGAFGVPTFFYKDSMFFGNDRLALLEQQLST